MGAAVLSFGRGMFSAGSSGGAMLQNEMAGGAADAAPETAPDTAQAPAFYDTQDAAAEKSTDGTGIPTELAEKITPTSGAGSGTAPHGLRLYRDRPGGPPGRTAARDAGRLPGAPWRGAA